MTVRSSTAFCKKFMWKFYTRNLCLRENFIWSSCECLIFSGELWHILTVYWKSACSILQMHEMQILVIYFQSLMGKYLNETGLPT